MTFRPFCGILFCMEKKYREDQIEKARYREKIIQAWLRGKKLSTLIKGAKEKLTRGQWWNLKKRYQEGGFWALIDRRRGGKPQKVTKQIREYIKEEKRSFPEITSKVLQEFIKHKFGQRISKKWLRQIGKELGERFRRGRPQTGRRDYKKGIPLDHAGVFFLKGADSDMEGVKTITEEIVQSREKDIPEKLALKRIRGTTPATVKKKVETLLYLPMFGMQKPYHLLKYHKRGLGILSGSGKRYSYYTTDIFLCDIEKLRIAQSVGDALARYYIEALCIEIELENGSYFYIDGHAKHVWSSRNIPKAFFTTLKRAERGLHQYFIHSTKGNPLILLTCPGDTRLPGVMFNLINAFENAVGKRIVKAAIFDREGLSLSIFKEFDDMKPKKYFITLLRDNMYKGEESFNILKDFIPLKTEEKNGELKVLEWVAEAKYKLKEKAKEKNEEEKRELIVRVALVRKKVNERIKLIPIITNLTRRGEPDIRRIAKRYFDRWPNQENIFRDTLAAIKVDTNHGYKKDIVPNRVVARKQEELEQNLRGISTKLRVAVREREQAAEQLQKLEQIYKTEKSWLQKDKSELYAKIKLAEQASQRQNLLKDLRDTENKLTRISEQYGRQLSELKTRLKNKEKHEKSLRTQKENKENEIKNLDLEKALYEIKTEKDHLMSNFKMLLINLSSYAQRQYFPKEVHNWTMESMMKAFYQQDGYVKIRKKRIDVMLYSYDEPDLQKAVEYACMKFNNSDVRTPEGQRIWIHAEGQNVKS